MTYTNRPLILGTLLCGFVIGCLVTQILRPDIVSAQGNIPDRVLLLEAQVADLQAQLTALQAQLDTHTANPSAHHIKTNTFSDLTDAATDAQIPDNITINFAATAGDANTVDGLEGIDLEESAEIVSSIATHAAIPDAHHTVPVIPLLPTCLSEDVNGDVVFEDCNVHIRSGSGATDGLTNGNGNLVIGYNEDASGTKDRTGSHNLIIGPEHSYPSFGGFVAGKNNTVSGEYASVTGGEGHTAGNNPGLTECNGLTGFASSVTGGLGSTACGSYSSISGGQGNIASGQSASVSGGLQNTAGAKPSDQECFGLAGPAASVNGGNHNTACGDYDSVSGGVSNTASGGESIVSGGDNNITRGHESTISGSVATVTTVQNEWCGGKSI